MKDFLNRIKNFFCITRKNSERVSLSNLHDPKRYEYQIEKICQNVRRKSLRLIFKLNYQEISLLTFFIHKRRVARILADTVRKEQFFLGLGKKRVITSNKHKKNEKKRNVYQFSLVEKIITGVVSQLLTEIAEPVYSPHCYAYRKNSDSLTVIKTFSKYIQNIREHEEKITDIYLMKFDIDNYTDNIRVDENSPLWPRLLECFDSQGVIPTDYQWNLIKSCIRPEFINSCNKQECFIRGIPTGTSITAFIYNFFSIILDERVSKLPAIFYARYGDDILIAHSDKDILKNAERTINHTLTELGLYLKPAKTFYGCLNTSGYSKYPQEWKGINSFDYLGYNVNGRGKFSISSRQQSYFIRHVHHKIKLLSNALSAYTTDEKGRTICQALNQEFKDSKLALAHTISLLRDTTNYDIFKHMDYLIALYIAQTLSHHRGPRAFRFIPYKKIREEWGLQPLLQLATYYAKSDA